MTYNCGEWRNNTSGELGCKHWHKFQAVWQQIHHMIQFEPCVIGLMCWGIHFNQKRFMCSVFENNVKRNALDAISEEHLWSSVHGFARQLRAEGRCQGCPKKTAKRFARDPCPTLCT